MRHSVLTAIFVAITVCTSLANANDDFATLLKDLTFADAAAQQTCPAASESIPDELRPVPTGLRTPVMLESSSASLQGIPAIPESKTASQVTLNRPVVSQSDSAVAVDAFQQAGRIGQPVVSPLQDPSLPTPAFASQLTGHRHHAVDTSCHAVAEHAIPCRPRTRPNLPSSTILQYFRSDACYTNVWDGYHRSCKHHDHLHGTCDCFRDQSPCGEVLPCEGNGCVSCDTGCDR